MSLIYNLERIERMHEMIAHRRTGTPEEFAEKIGVAKSTIYVLIKELKELGAPIVWCKYTRSYTYRYNVEFRVGFEHPSLSKRELRRISGGHSLNFNTFLI